MKTLVDEQTMLKSLLALKSELESQQKHSTVAREILFKLNSCLYSKYPHYENTLASS
jgi:hypothetical protein